MISIKIFASIFQTNFYFNSSLIIIKKAFKKNYDVVSPQKKRALFASQFKTFRLLDVS